MLVCSDIRDHLNMLSLKCSFEHMQRNQTDYYMVRFYSFKLLTCIQDLIVGPGFLLCSVHYSFFSVLFLDLHSLCWLSRNEVGWSDEKRCRENRTPPHNNLTLLSYFLPIVFCFFLLLVSGIFFSSLFLFTHATLVLITQWIITALFLFLKLP
jgi:hypothetical protein